MCLFAKHGQLSSSRSMATMWRAGHRGANLNSSGHPQCSNFEFTSGRQSEDVLNGAQRVLRVCRSVAGGENFPINSLQSLPVCLAAPQLLGFRWSKQSCYERGGGGNSGSRTLLLHDQPMGTRGVAHTPTSMVPYYKHCVAYWGHQTRSANEAPPRERARRVGVTKFHS